MKLYSGKEYLQIDIANNTGFDKLNFEDRIAKTKQMYPEDVVKTASNEVLKELVKKNQAEEPELTFAGLMAYRDTLNGIPSGYRVALDASCSGSQIMSALSRCPSGLYLTGLQGDDRMDLYTEVFKRFKEVSGCEKEISRTHIKKAIMVSLYGSTQKPERVLGKEFIPAFHHVMDEMCTGAWQLREFLLDEWNPEVDSQDWIMPDGFNVICPVINKVTYAFQANGEKYTFTVKEKGKAEHGLSNVANVTHSVDSYVAREITRRVKFNKAQMLYVLYLLNQYNLDHSADLKNGTLETMNTFDLLMHYYEDSNILTVRIADYIKSVADVARLSTNHRNALKEVISKMVQYEPFDIAIIHDSFSTLPDNLNYVRYWYNDILANIVDSDLLQCIVNQITLEHHELSRDLYTRKIIADNIRKSSYGIS